MRLSVTPIRRGNHCQNLLFQSIVLEEHQRPPIDLFDFKEIEKRHVQDLILPVITMCSYCQKIRRDEVGENNWIEADRYYALGGTSRVRISHGICSACLDLAETKAFR